SQSTSLKKQNRLRASCGCRNRTEPGSIKTQSALVGCTLGDKDDINTPVIGCASLARAIASRDSGSVNALLAQVFHPVGGALAGEDRRRSRRTGYRGRTVWPGLNANIRRASCCSSTAIIDMGSY